MADHANAATNLPTEEVQLWFGPVTRLVGRRNSPVLAQLPVGVYPDPEPGCACCPAKDWYLTRKGLRCFCTAKTVVAWVSNDDPVLVCDARERLIVEEVEDEIDGQASIPGGPA